MMWRAPPPTARRGTPPVTAAAAAPRPLAAPLDLVVFEAATLLDLADGTGAAPRPRPGAVRLVTALVQQGVAVAVVAGASGADGGTLPRDLGEAGFTPGLAASRVTASMEPAPGAADGTRGRAVVVTRRPGDAAGTVPGDAPGWYSVVTGERPVHRAVADWLTGRAGAFAAAARLCGPLDERAMAATRNHHLRLTKPAGSLGRIEDVGALLSGIAGISPPPRPTPAAVAVFAGDHGVHAQTVSPWPQEVTAQMVANFVAGGAAINVLARQVGADVVVVDVGVAADLPPARGLIDRKVRRGTADLTAGPAMTVDEARRALDVGAEVAARLVDSGARCLVTGDMGIAN